jgi:predicted PhzF superfamily epimerase YddE/YHI9
LRYLVLPVRSEALARARIARTDLDARLANLGAQFAYLLDARTLEARHWNNDGIVEDVATGSGAGCAAAYLRRHGLIPDGEAATLRQAASPAGRARSSCGRTARGPTSAPSRSAGMLPSSAKGVSTCCRSEGANRDTRADQ